MASGGDDGELQESLLTLWAPLSLVGGSVGRSSEDDSSNSVDQSVSVRYV